MGFEPMMRVLQTLALPLGHVSYSRFVGTLLSLCFLTLFSLVDSYHRFAIYYVHRLIFDCKNSY